MLKSDPESDLLVAVDALAGRKPFFTHRAREVLLKNEKVTHRAVARSASHASLIGSRSTTPGIGEHAWVWIYGNNHTETRWHSSPCRANVQTL